MLIDAVASDLSAPPAVYGAPGLEPPQCVTGPWSDRADVAIVGGGLTGLSAAYHLAGAGIRVAVLEAREIGRGASGRAFGQVVPYLRHGSRRICSAFGTDRGERIIAEIARGPDFVFDLIATERIACAAIRNGLLFGARTRRGLAALEATAAEWQQRGAPVALLDADGAAALTGSTLYPAALLDRRGGHLDPLAFTCGLARAAAARGAAIYSWTPVDRLARHGSRWRLTCGARQLTADTVILATNAYSGDLWPGLERSIVPLRIHAAVTAPLATEILDRILPGGQPLTDTRRLYSGVRKIGDRLHLTIDGPLLAQGGIAPLDGARARLLELYPWLALPQFTEQWSGWIAVTRDQFPHVHELAPGLWAGLGYSGRGLAAATIVGRDLARRIQGCGEYETVFPLSPLRRLPSRLIAAAAAAMTVAAYRWLDRLELHADRRHSVNRQSPARATSSIEARPPFR